MSDKIVPMDKKQDSPTQWLRAKAAMEYFQVSRNTLDKIARECDAVGKFGEKIVIYNVPKIERYITL